MPVLLEWETSPPKAPSAVTDRRREVRRGCLHPLAVATVLGREDIPAPCRIVDTSRSGMRIELQTAIPVGSQVQVLWDDHFFVGACRYRLAKSPGYVVGLEMITSSYTRFPRETNRVWSSLANFCASELRRIVRSVWSRAFPEERG